MLIVEIIPLKRGRGTVGWRIRNESRDDDDDNDDDDGLLLSNVQTNLSPVVVPLQRWTEPS